MPFIDVQKLQAFEPIAGCRLKTPFGEQLMFSYLEMDADAEIPTHHHQHEQGGIMLKGKLQLTIGDETRIITPGEMYLIPPNVPHRAVAIDGPATILDAFSPIREDYAKQMQAANSASS